METFERIMSAKPNNMPQNFVANNNLKSNWIAGAQSVPQYSHTQLFIARLQDSWLMKNS
jgi:hypothetical protein